MTATTTRARRTKTTPATFTVSLPLLQVLCKCARLTNQSDQKYVNILLDPPGTGCSGTHGANDWLPVRHASTLAIAQRG
jgi:hypothetical protein